MGATSVERDTRKISEAAKKMPRPERIMKSGPEEAIFNLLYDNQRSSAGNNYANETWFTHNYDKQNDTKKSGMTKLYPSRGDTSGLQKREICVNPNH